MNRRTLIRHGVLGAAVLGFGGMLQRPSYGLQFDLQEAPDIVPSDLESLTIDVKKFQLIPQYVDERQDATITAILKLGDLKTKTKSTTVSLENGEVTDIQDVQELFPIGLDNIPTIEEDFVRGSVTIQVDHPSLTRAFRESYIITGPDGRTVSIDTRLDSSGNAVNFEQEEIISCDLSVTLHQPTEFFGARFRLYDSDNNIPLQVTKRNTNTGDSRQLGYLYPEQNIGDTDIPASGGDSFTSTFRVTYDGTSSEIYYNKTLIDTRDIGSFSRINFDQDDSAQYMEVNGTITVK